MTDEAIFNQFECPQIASSLPILAKTTFFIIINEEIRVIPVILRETNEVTLTKASHSENDRFFVASSPAKPS